MVKKAKELEVEDARIVSTDCGFYVYFQDAMTEGPEKRLEMLEEDLVSASKELIRKHPDVGAIVLECTAFPLLRMLCKKATGLSVFAIVMLLNWIGDAVVRERYPPMPTL